MTLKNTIERIQQRKHLYIKMADIHKGVAMIFCWGGPDFKPQTNDR
jgi:hypothetical protein